MFSSIFTYEFGLILSLLAFGLFLLGAAGSGKGWWRHEVGFGLVGLSALTALSALAVVVRSWFVFPGSGFSLSLVAGIAGALLGVVLVVIPIAFLFKVATTPWIHDITTDFDNPPAFEAARALRPAHADPVEYPGDRVAAIQRVSYPKVVAKTTDASSAVVYARALKLAQSNRWRIVATRPEEGTFEAVAISALFGFQDDIVVRVTPMGFGSRVDMRSAARVGDTDLGVNANRIVTFLAAL